MITAEMPKIRPTNVCGPFKLPASNIMWNIIYSHFSFNFVLPGYALYLGMHYNPCGPFKLPASNIMWNIIYSHFSFNFVLPGYAL